MEEKVQTNGSQEYKDQDITFEANSVQTSYQQRMKDGDLSLSMPEEKATEEVTKQTESVSTEVTDDLAEQELKKKKEKEKSQKSSTKSSTKKSQKKSKEPDISEEEYYSTMSKAYSIEDDFGFYPDEFEEEFDFSTLDTPVKKQIQINEAQIDTAEALGADEEDIDDMRSFNKEQGKNYQSLQKQKEALEIESNPWLKRQITREQREVLSTLQRFGKTIEQANLSFNVKGKEVYKGLTKPFRELSRSGHGKRAERFAGKLEKQKRSLTRAIERADEAASIKRNKIRQKKGVALEVEAYRSVRDQKRINRLNHLVNRTVIAINTEKAMIDRSVAYEARLEDKITKSIAKKQEIKEILDRQPTKEERMVMQKEKEYEKEMTALEMDIRKRDALARAAELDELTKAAKEERKEVKEQTKQIKKSTVLDEKILEANLAADERAMEKNLAYIEKNLMTGKSVTIETETGKFRAYKELNGEMKIERWNEKREMFEETSKLATISAFAKDQKLVTRKIDQLFEGQTKSGPEKETDERSRE